MAKSVSYPRTASDFLRLLEKSGTSSAWHIETIASESDDETSPTRITFRLAVDEERRGFVAFEQGKLIVNFANGRYHFELDRLHEDPGHGWKKHMSEKEWFSAVEKDLLDALYELIPPPS